MSDTQFYYIGDGAHHGMDAAAALLSGLTEDVVLAGGGAEGVGRGRGRGGGRAAVPRADGMGGGRGRAEGMEGVDEGQWQRALGRKTLSAEVLEGQKAWVEDAGRRHGQGGGRAGALQAEGVGVARRKGTGAAGVGAALEAKECSGAACVGAVMRSSVLRVWVWRGGRAVAPQLRAAVAWTVVEGFSF